MNQAYINLAIVLSPVLLMGLAILFEPTEAKSK